MPRALPSLNAIRAFESAARLASFSRAADELNVTQSAVSRQIQKLEAELGQALFSRNGPHLKLTDRGREYFTVVQQGLGVIKRGTERLFRHSAPVLTITSGWASRRMRLACGIVLMAAPIAFGSTGGT